MRMGMMTHTHTHTLQHPTPQPPHTQPHPTPPTPPCRMDEVCGQSRLFAVDGEDVRLPVAHMVCNQTPPLPSENKPSLMTFRWGWGWGWVFMQGGGQLVFSWQGGVCLGGAGGLKRL
jgi:hypothetical protein